jgi:hypothetical protein
MPQRECELSVFCVDVEGLQVFAVGDGFLWLLAQCSGPDKGRVKQFEEDLSIAEVGEVRSEWNVDLDRVWRNPLEENRIGLPSNGHSICPPLLLWPTTCDPPCSQLTVQFISLVLGYVGVCGTEGNCRCTFYGLCAFRSREDV